jgi:uncharacterized membrane protein YebE (DUF533 family)
MNLQSLLNQVLGGSQGSPQGHGGAPSSSGGSHLGKYLAGGAAGGALGLLLGSRRGRSVGGKALKYGSVAAVGALAWKLYQDHQAKQQAQQAQQAPAAFPAAGAPAYRAPSALPAPSWEQMPVVQIEAHAQAMLKALIAAAKSDGHMDERERELLQGELTRLNADPATRAWVEAELKKPVEPADVAASVTSPEMAAEVYLASLLVVDETTTMERAYLDELARRLNLPPALKADLEAKAAAA